MELYLHNFYVFMAETETKFYVLLTCIPVKSRKWSQLSAQFILNILINLYMFRATICPSSGETTEFMRHLVLVIQCGWLSGMQGGFHLCDTWYLLFCVDYCLVCRVESTLHIRQ